MSGLKNKPLVEVIFEVRWALTSTDQKIETDPHYKLLVGRLYDKLTDSYPEHEQLPTAFIPDELVAHQVQHRFRVAAGGWPLVQVGPGILTVNDTDGYSWEAFRERCLNAVESLFSAYPKPEELTVSSLILRYIDAVEFDHTKENSFAFLVDKMRVGIQLPKRLFTDTGVSCAPLSFNWQSSFRCGTPPGEVNIRFTTGKKKGEPAVIWETVVCSADADVPNMLDGCEEWIDAAHSLTHDWFFKLIAGDLERRFSGD